jgi:hypothetical protein
MDFEASLLHANRGSFLVFFVGEEEFSVVVRTTVIWHIFRGAERGQIRTTVQDFLAHFPRQKFGTVGCCKLFLLAVNVLLLLIYLS